MSVLQANAKLVQKGECWDFIFIPFGYLSVKFVTLIGSSGEQLAVGIKCFITLYPSQCWSGCPALQLFQFLFQLPNSSRVKQAIVNCQYSGV